jgi:hypothetical protein
MTRKHTLPLAPTQTSLGLPTVMDRDLVAAHGVSYVQLAVFAIDIDRVYWLEPELDSLPFGWEVFLTEWFLLAHILPDSEKQRDLLEAICVPLLDETPGEPPLGGQIIFAVYDAVQRGVLDPTLIKLFAGWRTPPREMVNALAALHVDPLPHIAKFASYCLQAELEPPLAPPTREALLKLTGG